MKFRVQTIPTLMLFKDGEVMARIAGVRGKEAILKEIQAFVPA